MPSGISRLFQNYTDADLLASFASVQQRMFNGSFTTLSGAQKSASVQFMELDKQLKEINWEMNARGLTANINGPQKVTQVMRPRNPNGYYDEGYYQ